MPMINGLTTDQVEMLDFMWSLDSEQEFLTWYDTLNDRDQRQADLLQRMIIMASIDDDMEAQTEYPEAQRVIRQILDRPAI